MLDDIKISLTFDHHHLLSETLTPVNHCRDLSMCCCLHCTRWCDESNPCLSSLLNPPSTFSTHTAFCVALDTIHQSLTVVFNQTKHLLGYDVKLKKILVGLYYFFFNKFTNSSYASCFPHFEKVYAHTTEYLLPT